ncbi:MAG: hypothetical protein CVV64_09125 [Candidatus Wallbacteria bacterium HGW-Wallbacteria-1]|uniref:Phosphate/phosphite/phosphonate ABC transporter substrate-binding protein n=1 Tax=Candidatus Wallbacteria bacterium HGW-Wallbacteria-1 TaxID=2013854 RepID=A0A2N1PQA2_9BACT|nr:MAG: hypothetical protein CVV64_09125 [Candidatus Wallbacteria bacterium HGW-Wallbacteria-1]
MSSIRTETLRFMLFALLILPGLIFAGCGSEPVRDSAPDSSSASAGVTQVKSGTPGEPSTAVSSEPTSVSAADPSAVTQTGQPAAETAKTAVADSGGAHRTLRMARIPFRNARELVITHEPMMKYLAARLGVDEVKLVSATDYKGIVDLLKNDSADMAWMGTFNYLDAQRSVDVVPVVRPKRFGKSTYGGLVIAHQDSGIEKLTQLKGKSFAFVDRKSASGYLFPKAALIRNGIDPEHDFSEVKYLKQHDSVCMAVLYRKIDAGAIYDDARMKLKSREQAAKLKVIETIANIPNEPIVVSRKLDKATVEKITSAFLSLSMENPDGKVVLEQFNSVCADHIEGFEKADDADYDVIRDMDRVLKEFDARNGATAQPLTGESGD